MRGKYTLECKVKGDYDSYEAEGLIHRRRYQAKRQLEMLGFYMEVPLAKALKQITQNQRAEKENELNVRG